MERQYTESFLLTGTTSGWTGGANGIMLSENNLAPNSGVTASVSLWRDGGRRTLISVRPGTILPLKIRFLQSAAGNTFYGFN